MIQTGTLFKDTYRILSEILHNDISVSHMALDEKSNKICIINQIKKSSADQDNSVFQKFISETETLKNCNHPNLQKIIDIIVNDESVIIITDYIEGKKLDIMLQENGAISQDFATETAKQLCRIFEYIHSRGASSILTNITPKDIILKPDGSFVLTYSALTKTIKQTDNTNAVFSLGCILFNLFTGIIQKHDLPQGKSVRKIKPELSVKIDAIITKCLSEDPEVQYQSYAEILQDLEYIDNPDIIPKKKQKQKLTVFAMSVILTVAFGAMSVLCYFFAEMNKNTDTQLSEETSTISADTEKTTPASESLISESSTQCNSGSI